MRPLKPAHIEAAIAARNAIDSNPLSRKKLSEIAPGITIGRNALLAAFRLLTGTTIRRYRMIKRMEEAGKLLLAGTFNIKQVAYECGYLDKQNNFFRDFKEVHQLTPEDWVKQQQNNTGTTNTEE